jgi:uncharacterized protein (TIGR00251 family)
VSRIAIHATPKSGRDEVVGWKGSELVVRVTAAPEGGKANAAVCKVLADALDLPKTSVRVVRGEASRHKIVDVTGIDEDGIAEKIGEPGATLF